MGANVLAGTNISIDFITFECILDAFDCIFIDLIALGYSTELNWAETIKVGRLAFTPSSPKHTLPMIIVSNINTNKDICQYGSI